MESANLLIGHKHDKEIYLIEIFVAIDYGSCLWVHVGTRLDIGEKNIIFRSITFQNVVQNSSNAGLATHL
jgi:hypothetical protein